MDGEPRPRQHPAQVVYAVELADGVEAPVEDAVAVLKVGEQAVERLCCGPRLRGQVGRLGLAQLLPHPVEARRVLPDQQLRGEVEGVESAREGSQLRLVDLEAHHLADAELDPVEAHGPVVFEVRQHEEEGQLGRGSLRSASSDSVGSSGCGTAGPSACFSRLRVSSVVRSGFSFFEKLLGWV